MFAVGIHSGVSLGVTAWLLRIAKEVRTLECQPTVWRSRKIKGQGREEWIGDN
ncbi:hypothetical protein JOF34_001843 [Microbacterium amylolyticum]|uniref:Uncharacterized protein n=1 Tax=Microbacterium amylolyticum TaxID=936337 RepID=A0ABS4ZIZ2_9MICO|nr:hypothetical protein [Microbacterium amylolyticum]